MITKAIFFKAAKRARILIRCCFACNARLLQNVGKGGNRGVVVQIMKESRMVKNGWHKLGTKQGGHLIKNVLLLSLPSPLEQQNGNWANLLWTELVFCWTSRLDHLPPCPLPLDTPKIWTQKTKLLIFLQFWIFQAFHLCTKNFNFNQFAIYAAPPFL